MPVSPVPFRRYVLFFALASLGLAADLLSKQWAFNKLGMPLDQPPWWLWEGYAGFETSLNQGALFGLGQGWVNLFAMLSIVALAAILLWLFVAKAAHDFWLTACLGLITAGVLGNLYDRLGMHQLVWTEQLNPALAGQRVYAVRDFILVQLGDQWRWPNFNIADSLLVCGAGLLVCLAIRTPETAPSATEAKPLGSARSAEKRNVA